MSLSCHQKRPDSGQATRKVRSCQLKSRVLFVLGILPGALCFLPTDGRICQELNRHRGLGINAVKSINQTFPGSLPIPCEQRQQAFNNVTETLWIDKR